MDSSWLFYLLLVTKVLVTFGDNQYEEKAAILL